MSSVTLDRLWLQTASDLEDSLLLRWVTQDGFVDPYGYVEQYASGAERSIAVDGFAKTIAFSVPYVSRADFADLEARATSKAVHLARDARGRMYGRLEGLSWSEARHRDVVASVRFTLRRVTYTEVV